MQDVYETAKKARGEILKWAQRRCGGRLPPEAWDLQSFEYFSGGRNSIGIRLQNEQFDIWTLRADDPDKTVARRVWTTEVAVSVVEDGVRFSVRLLNSTDEDKPDIQPHVPGFVRQLAERMGIAQDGWDVRHVPWLINSNEDAEELVEFLLDEKRKSPVFVLAVPEDASEQNKPLVAVEALAKAVTGIGCVAIVPAAFTWALTERFGKQRSVYNGAIRTYMSGFTEDASPYNHRLILAETLKTQTAQQDAIKMMCRVAAEESIRRHPLGKDVVPFSEVRVASVRLKQDRLEETGASDTEKLDVAKERIKALEEQNIELEKILEYFASEHEKIEERAQVAEQRLNGNAFRIRQLEDQLKTSGAVLDADIRPPERWSDFGEWCDNHLSGRVVLASLARRNARSPEFTDIPQVARCFLWLANECRERRINGGDGSLREESVGDGIKNAHCGSDVFDIDWQGEKHQVDWHIKKGGNTRDPKRCLRIYYFWEPNTQQIVVADMPAHRRTGAT
jgi:hypothetical protein